MNAGIKRAFEHSANWRSLVHETADNTVHPLEPIIQRLCHSHELIVALNKTKKEVY